MKQLLTILILIISFGVSGQAIPKVATVTVTPPLKWEATSDSTGKLIAMDATSTSSGLATAAQVTLLANTAAATNSNTAAIGVLTSDVKTLATTVSSIVVSGKASKDISASQYTISSDDNGRVLYFYTGCTVTFPFLPTDFKCTMVRVGVSKVSLTGQYVTRYGYTPMSTQYGSCEVIKSAGTAKAIVK